MHKPLQAAVQRCQVRGLSIAASWAAEQLLGFSESNENDSGENEMVSLTTLNTEIVPKKELALVLMGSSLLTLGEYQRCASLFVEKETQTLLVSSPLALYLHIYSQYMAGEKALVRGKRDMRKITFTAEAMSEDSAGSKKFTPRSYGCNENKNAYLPYLNQLLTKYHRNTDHHDGFLLYLLALIGSKYRAQYGLDDTADDSHINPYEVYKQSIAAYPYNWSCWMDLATYCLENNKAVPSFQQLQSYLKEDQEVENVRLMHAFFITHIFLEKHRGDLALQVLKGLHQTFPQSLYIYAQIGRAYYSQRFYDQAQDCFEFVYRHDPYQLQYIDTFSNILYVQEKAQQLSTLAHHVMKIEKYSTEVCCVVGNYYSLKGQHEKAVTYFQRALLLNPLYLPAWTLMGHEFIELHNLSTAVACYRQAVDIYTYDYRPWYGLGQAYEILHLYQYAIYYFKKAAALRPFDARMWSAVGHAYCKLNMIRDAMVVYERAVKAGDREGIATRELAGLYRNEQDDDRAAELYYKYIVCSFANQSNDDPARPIAPNNLPPSLTDLVVALHSHSIDQANANGAGGYDLHTSQFGVIHLDNMIDSEQAEACLFLVTYFHSKHDLVVTEFFCSRLLGFAGPEGDEARLIMRNIRSQVLPTNLTSSSYLNRSLNVSQPLDISDFSMQISNVLSPNPNAEATPFSSTINNHMFLPNTQHNSVPYSAIHPPSTDRRDSFDPFARYLDDSTEGGMEIDQTIGLHESQQSIMQELSVNMSGGEEDEFLNRARGFAPGRRK